MTKKTLSFLFILSLVFSTLAGEKPYIHHQLAVAMEPEAHFIRVTDTIHVPDTSVEQNLHFLLHSNLNITSHSNQIILKREPGELKTEYSGINTAEFEIKKKIPVSHYSVRFKENSEKSHFFTLTYEGIINHPIEMAGGEYARGFSETPGIICGQGVYLAGTTFWIPWFNDDPVTFRLETRMPQGWTTVSQGKRLPRDNRTQLTTWDSAVPMEEVYLIAARFTEYDLKAGNVELMVFLRSQDENLANRYLETTGQYLEMYEKLIGPYPFSKFALIENFWETGYGMSSFTLLGPKVIRFPFILHSSYPHELLHNWWGNSVYVDYRSGNWCEGLTVYLADHLIKEQRGMGEEYRKTALQEYTHYASGQREEFPLSQFKARSDALSSSIGYGKSMMIFHMLRQMVGDQPFRESIRNFYRENRYRKASFDDIRKSFETVTGMDLGEFFKQWVNRTGVPEIQLSDTQVKKQGDHYSLNISLTQNPQHDPYRLRIPLAITLEGKPEAVVKLVDCTERQNRFSFFFRQRPLAVAADPRFDVMRKLHEKEIPATLSSAFGAKSVLILLPSAAPEEILRGYKQLAETWSRDGNGQVTIQMDRAVNTLPDNRAVWLFGRENLHIAAIGNGISEYPVKFQPESLVINNRSIPLAKASVVVAVKNNLNPSQSVILLSTDRIAALPGLGRKLPHYGKYSFLAFEGDEPVNILKGQWPVIHSPLLVFLDPSSQRDALTGSLPKRRPLATLAPLFSIRHMVDHIRYLASAELAGRELGSEGLDKAAFYIAEQFKAAGLQPVENHSYFQTWEAKAGRGGKTITLRNVIGVLPGKDPKRRGEAIILCAHYDHLGLGWPDVHRGDEGKIHPGADDNASGVAVMLELARVLGSSLNPDRTLLFIAFTGEENGLLGSSYYVNNLKINSPDRLKGIMAVVNLDTVGRLKDGDKLMVIGGSSAREWRFIFMGIGYTVGIESLLVSQDLDASDQVSFSRAGIPAIQLFSGPHADYHRPTDTPDKIEEAGLAKVAAVAREAIVYLTERKEPLTFEGKAEGIQAQGPTTPPSSGGRKVRTGIMPDFGFSGKGMKIAAVSPGSPADKAGLRKGDIIIRVGEVKISSLREYAAALKSRPAGEPVLYVYLREGREYTVQLVPEAR